MSYDDLAAKSLRGEVLSREECHRVLAAPDSDILDLLAAAYRVRRAHFGRRVRIHLLINAKSGSCLENCAYCSQSAASEAEIQRYSLVDDDKLLDGARAAAAARAVRYCIVTSGRAPSERELERICRAVRAIKREVPLSICTSLGFLTDSSARALKEAGVDRYNHNLNTSEPFYANICTSHGYQDRIRTLAVARAAGLELCCGAIFGMGERDEDIAQLSLALREVGPESIPVNFLHPVPGTPLEGTHTLTPNRCLKILSLVRLTNPCAEVRVAGGRELNLRSLQPMVLYAANSIFVSGYLTTSGQSPREAWQMIEDLGFEVEQEIADEVSVPL